MSAPRVVSVAAASPAQRAGLCVGDELVAIDGQVPRDVIEYRLLVDEADPELSVRRGHETLTLAVSKEPGEALGAEVSSAVFDRVRTCDNHCEFCFIHQLPKGMRRSLYLKDDDYRLSFLYGNFTTLTRFTDMDFERVLADGLSPLFVSIHATDPVVRARLLRNPRGAVSLRWLRALLDAGVEVHGQIVVCPGLNDDDVLDDTLAGILDEYPALATAACVPLGVSRFSTEGAMRPHTPHEAAAVVDTVERWQELFTATLGRRMVYAADEYYLMAGRPFPHVTAYDGFPQHENGIGIARAFSASFAGERHAADGVRPGFFAWVDGAPAEGYRASRQLGGPTPRRGAVGSGGQAGAAPPVTVVSGVYGAQVLAPLLADAYPPGSGVDVEVLAVPNRFFGGNIAVTGLLVGEDIAAALASRPATRRFLLPDVCLSQGRFLDGTAPADLPVAVEVVATDGRSLRRAIEGTTIGAGDGPVAGGRRTLPLRVGVPS